MIVLKNITAKPIKKGLIQIDGWNFDNEADTPDISFSITDQDGRELLETLEMLLNDDYNPVLKDEQVTGLQSTSQMPGKMQDGFVLGKSPKAKFAMDKKTEKQVFTPLKEKKKRGRPPKKQSANKWELSPALSDRAQKIEELVPNPAAEFQEENNTIAVPTSTSNPMEENVQ